MTQTRYPFFPYRCKVSSQQITAELRHRLAELRGEPIFLGGYEQEKRLLELASTFLRTASSRRSAREHGLLSILEAQAGGGSIINHAVVPRLLLSYAPDGFEVHKEIALHHSFLPAGLARALPRTVDDLERLLRQGADSSHSRRPVLVQESDSDSDEETGHQPRDSTVRLDLIRVALDGAFSWVQLMLMLTCHEELLESLAMKILRDRNVELSSARSDANSDDVHVWASPRELPMSTPGPGNLPVLASEDAAPVRDDRSEHSDSGDSSDSNGHAESHSRRTSPSREGPSEKEDATSKAPAKEETCSLLQSRNVFAVLLLNV